MVFVPTTASWTTQFLREPNIFATDNLTPLSEATVQEIQLELIRRTQFNAFDGEQVVAALRAHPDLWEAVFIDRPSFSNPGQLPDLIKLRDLSRNSWNVDTLYVLTPDVPSAWQLAEIAQRWGGEVSLHDERDEIEDALGGGGERQAIVSIWWD